MKTIAEKKVLIYRGEIGSVVMSFLVMLPILLASFGLALDIGKFYVVRSELQNAADACALAAAFELDGTATGNTRATAAGLSTAARNRVYFDNVAVAGTTVDFPNTGLVRCNVAQPNIPNWFIQMLGFQNQTIRTNAVASNVSGQSICALPIGICNVPATTPPGTWIEGVQSAAGGNTGFFRWIDFDPPMGGAPELKNSLSQVNACVASSPTPGLSIGSYGVVSSADTHYNTRFGIRAGGTPANSAPDYSGHAYFPTNWPSKFNAYSDFVATKRPTNVAYTATNGISIAGSPTILNSAELATQGSNRRVAIAPVIDCTGANPTFQRYACIFLLHPMSTSGPPTTRMYLEYLGDADSPGPCRTLNLAGPANGNGPRVTTLVQ